MLSYYEIFYGKSVVGTLNVKKEGLYYVFHGKINRSMDRVWRIIAISDNTKVDIGICVPYSSDLIFQKRIPRKNFVDAIWRFEAVENHAWRSKAIDQNRPFEDLDRIEQGRAMIQNDGSICIVYTDQ